ncbi:DUF4258 domain-containing protein [Candidatus Nitrosotenuis cloacae]|uniref:DUF4258 domain-containing protein n=1 Tax=Candidatus Nitrosotenuis cloacae TaxID=1603555 RepID=UPI003B9690E6
MPQLKIILTAHVRERAVSRGIDEEEIKRIVTNPIEEVFDKENFNYKCYGQAMDHYTKQTCYLMVVHSGKFNNSVTVITSMWIYPRRLKFYGFSKV